MFDSPSGDYCRSSDSALSQCPENDTYDYATPDIMRILLAANVELPDSGLRHLHVVPGFRLNNQLAHIWMFFYVQPVYI